MMKGGLVFLVLSAAVLADPPTISLGALRREGEGSWRETSEEIVAAIRTWGFFHVTDHGVSQDLERRLIQETILFFQSP